MTGKMSQVQKKKKLNIHQKRLKKNVIFLAPAFSEKEDNSEDWNMCCVGNLKLDKEKSIAIIEGETK